MQDIVCDPNTPGRLILVSDMEGIYQTLDHGDSWHIMGDLHQNRVFSVAYAKGKTNKLFVGTLYGLEVSNDSGKSFKLIEQTKRKSIAAITASPHDSNIVIAGLGWRDDYDFSHTFGLGQSGKGELYRSTDGGETWSHIYFENAITEDRNVVNILFDETDSNIVYLGASNGIYKSTDAGKTWAKIKGPSGVAKNRGVALTPDGKTLYAAYSTQGNKGYLYASPTSHINWTDVSYGNNEFLGHFDFWYPEVDPRSQGGKHKVTVGLQSGREGVFEGVFNWEDDALSHYEWSTIWKGTKGFDTGWDFAPTNPRFVHYTPKKWDYALWSTTNQTIFQAVLENNTYQWKNKYCIPNESIKASQWGMEFPTYSSRGTESTYTYDIAVHNNYVVQGMGDNGAVESWDHGKTWSNMQIRLSIPPLSDVQAVDIANRSKTPIVVAQMTSGYGGGALNGNLYAKRLKHNSPKDEWVFIGGGWEHKGGLPSGVFRDVAVSPVNDKMVFLYSTDHGLYLIDDIEQTLNDVEQGKAARSTKISNGVADGIHAVKKIAPHPTNVNIVYINGTRGNKEGVFKGEKKGKNWEWSKIYEGSNWDSEIVAWEHEGQVYLFFSGASAEKGGDGSNFVGALSLDEGKTWKTIITKKTAMKLNSNSWYDAIADDFRFHNKGGALGYKNTIIMSYYDHRMQKAYGVYKGTIHKNGKVTWEDWTDNLYFGGLTSSIIANQNGVPYVFVSTAGAGAWKRPL
ncbi:hypothetical protein [Tamlana sp. I1]|uniref:hypothetical protein n=1 Tax=Tamlana sp. I1 TaxID=2762061 RepID=UPI00188FCB5A|nr:hypothetical protein [Tamlana sp. I1]